MIEHTFAKLYGTMLELKLSKELECRKLRVVEHVGFMSNYQTIDHISTLRGIIKEATSSLSKSFVALLTLERLRLYSKISTSSTTS